ncbi:Starch-binding associating with outer membrane [Catalinimonas alkaloidigena]|uniref:Starch-binding associating with outer membrane n=1 Tax=Catalinimonas alkaloidigena TaxID=1075417 RepID=A0A1G9KZ35_9BACT|nr:RagB/SusD family nutrient uptake outer membrane protein [Catalinimonas alkaloidigena]SDL54836.1 Starch-binding associating with outer membrane [Catalinimonas alkaloidigena]
MKKLTYILLFTAAGLCWQCGNDYLDIEPETYQSGNNFFQTPEQFNQALNAAYEPLQGIYNNQFWALAEMRSDNTSYQYNTGDRSGFALEEIDTFRELPDNTYLGSFFSASYEAISRCNVIIGRIADAPVDDATRQQVLGEAHFLRAFYYFNLVRVFGEVPLVLAEVQSVAESFNTAERRSVAEVYAAIVQDAMQARDNLPLSYNAANLGRATQGTARCLLAEVYVTQQQFSNAVTELQALVASNQYQLYASYADNFSVAMKNGVESIFEVQYMEGPNGEYSGFIYTFAPYNSGDAVAGFAVASGAFAGWNIPTQDLLDSYEEGDLRKEASVGFYTDSASGDVIPYVKKYQSSHAVRYQTGNNFPIYRYSDALLMLAEALNEVGFQQGGEAFNLINQVRNRAGLPDVVADSQESFRAAVAHERRIELAFEDHRWFDLLRTGQAVPVMEAHAQEEKALKSYLVPSAYAQIRLLYPYPQRETQLTGQ